MTSIGDLRAGMLVLDHFSQILGDIDENTSQVAGVMANLRMIAEEKNLALVLVHHVVKGITRFGISTVDSIRGHSSILAGCDLAAVIERQLLDPLGVNIRTVAARGPSPEGFSAKFSFEQKVDGSLELKTARFWGESLQSIDFKIESAVIEVLEESPGINQTLLRSLISEKIEGAGDPAIRKVISRMAKTGQIQVKNGKQNSKIYSLTGGASG